MKRTMLHEAMDSSCGRYWSHIISGFDLEEHGISQSISKSRYSELFIFTLYNPIWVWELRMRGSVAYSDPLTSSDNLNSFFT